MVFVGAQPLGAHPPETVSSRDQSAAASVVAAAL